MAGLHRFTHALHLLELWIFNNPRKVLTLIALLTLFFALRIPGLKIYTDFADLLPQQHPYIHLHNSIKDDFGGANVLVVGIEFDEGDIFTNERLALIDRVTQAVDNLPGVNHNLVSSVTHRNSRKIWLTEVGSINSQPYFDATKGPYDAEALAGMKADVSANPRVFGPLVAPDLKMALVKAQLIEGQLDYEKTFIQLRDLRDEVTADGITLYATGQPVLVGWAYTYMDQILQIFAFTVLTMLALLIFHFRKAYGVLIPLGGVLISTVWGLGIISLLGYNLDPLGLVIPFLIAARAMSHGVQLVERYYAEAASSGNGPAAAKATFDSLFRPGSLGVVSDAIGLLLIAVGSIPLNTHLGIYASMWAITVVFSVLIGVPLLLSILPTPREPRLKETILRHIGASSSRIVSRPGSARTLLLIAAAAVVLGMAAASNVQIGDSEPGSPILYPDHDYNISSRVVNERFPGSEELYVVAETDEKGGLKRPEVLKALAAFQAHMLTDPGVGGAKGLPDLIQQVNRLMHNNDPRWYQIPHDERYVGGLMFTYMASSPIPGALDEFNNTDDQVANLVFYYKDRQGETIRRAIHMAKQWIDEHGDEVEGLTIKLAGGTLGVAAAMNESAYQTNLIVLPLVFLLIFAFVTLFYTSWHAGLMMLLAMLFATTLTYAYMGLSGLNIDINTVPVIAVGIGVGIDYSIYMMDRIREEMAKCRDLAHSVQQAISTTGMAISFTALTLMAGIVMWVIFSDLRFQSDSALLLCVMIVINGITAMLLVPSWVLRFQPRFITAVYADDDGVLHAGSPSSSGNTVENALGVSQT
ncbi:MULTISPECIES: MMPL family transporter [Spongiibacter]|uniref:efflux RND transporter permease subunit n=3 Tax=Spongiibacteraceae TaxID=1706375 RepID=UPI000C6AC5DC|nr:MULTISPECIES: MMPL family transporter [Spongiibacter]MAY39253.1 transporter [Spongiibacter sp.]MBI57580.1 transporter [Spongiibacter sp.]|tara:strand:- start:60292 stop:62727 length:2436 start_codon:yes stop_codon:yes gene_type:complete